MTEQEKTALELAKSFAKRLNRTRTDLTEWQKDLIDLQIDQTGYETEAFVEFCKSIGIWP